MPALIGGFGKNAWFGFLFLILLLSYENHEILYCLIPLIKPTRDPYLGSYLAGLIEGDGCIVVPKEERSSLNKRNYAFIKVCFNIKDLPLAEKLQKSLGGILKINKTKTYVEWVIQREKDLIIISR
jgi:hypothetical protein